MKVDMSLLGARLRSARQAAGLSQTALAARAEVDLGNLNELEHGRKPSVRLDTMVALAEALGRTLDYFTGRCPILDVPPKRRKRVAV
jgi:transcriptional regulator with XRE-family HTH domain